MNNQGWTKINPDWTQADHDLYGQLARRGYSHEQATDAAYNQWRNANRERQGLGPIQTMAMPYEAPITPRYAPFKGSWEQPTQPMRANSGAGWGGPPNFASNPDSADWYRKAPGYRPGMGSMTPDEQSAKDREWELNFNARQAALDKIPAHVPWGDPRIQQVMNTPVQGGIQGPIPFPTQQDATAYNRYPSMGSSGPTYTPSQLAEWEKYQQVMADQRPYVGLR